MLVSLTGYVKKKKKSAASLQPNTRIPTHNSLVLCEVCDPCTSSADSRVAQLGLFVWFPGTTARRVEEAGPAQRSFSSGLFACLITAWVSRACVCVRACVHYGERVHTAGGANQFVVCAVTLFLFTFTKKKNVFRSVTATDNYTQRLLESKS